MIVDSFIFFNELDILDIRLKTLYPFVDKFVIVESNQTFTLHNSPKPLYFEKNKDRFKPYLDKIVYLKMENEFKRGDPWGNEFLQRNAIGDVLKDICRNDDIVLMSDVDEIPNPQSIINLSKEFNVNEEYVFMQTMYRYFFNVECTHEKWKGTRATSYSNLMTRYRGECERFRHSNGNQINNGGWHFTGCLGLKKFIEKMKSFSHADICDTPEYTDEDNMRRLFEENVINKGIDVHHFNNATYRVDYNWKNNLPEVCSEYPEYIYNGGEW